jgi:hypothetical protein
MRAKKSSQGFADSQREASGLNKDRALLAMPPHESVERGVQLLHLH